MVLASKKHINQWNRIEDPYVNPHRYNYLIFKWPKICTKEKISQQMVLIKHIAMCKRMKLDLYL